MNKPADACSPVTTRIHKPSVEKRPWRVTAPAEEALKAQMLIQAAIRKG